MAGRDYRGSQTQKSEIDPRLHEVSTTSQSYTNAPALSDPSNHFRPPPPSPFQQQQQQYPQPHLHHQQQYGPPRAWQQDGFSYYASSAQHPSPVAHMPQHPASAYQPYQDPTGAHTQPAMQAEASDSKRARACEACRNLKVKCEPALEGGQCKRCVKAGRNCVTSAPSRKRQKKTDSRVADLEKRIDDLQRQMKSAKAENASESDVGDDTEGGTSLLDLMGSRPDQQSSYNLNPPADVSKRRFAEFEHDAYSGATPLNVHLQQNQRSAMGAPVVLPEASMRPDARTRAMKQEGPKAAIAEVDVVDRGLVHPTIADDLFIRYTKLMAPHMPIVVFPDDVTSESVRRSSPILFLAILSVAAGEAYQDLQIKLQKEIMHTLAGRIVITGDKSLELVQALQVVTIWYWKEANGDSKYYQLVHMAATMAIDLRLNKNVEVKRPPLFDLQQPRSFVSDTASLECRRAWLGCYLLTSSIAMGMRRPALVRHSDNNKYFEDCIARLRRPEDSMDKDHQLCDLVRLQTFADNMAVQILPDDSTIMPEAKVRSAQKVFEKQMKDWREQSSSLEEPLSISLAYNVINLYMSELAMQRISSPEPSKTARARSKINQSYTQPGFNTALTSTLGVLDTFSRFSVQEIRALPVFHFAQIAHAAVSLIKIYFAAKISSEYRNDAPVTANMVEERLSSLLSSLRSSAADGKSLAAHAYLKMMGALQTVFMEHKHSAMESIKARFSGVPSMNNTQILELEEPQSTGQQRTASHRTGGAPGNKLDLLSAAAMEQSNAYGSEGSDARSGISRSQMADDGDMVAMGQLIGERDVGFMSDEGFLGIMQTMF